MLSLPNRHLILGAVAMVATLPGRTQGLGLITEPLLESFQLSRIDYASINLWATLIGSLFCLPCGRLTDTLGSRSILTFLLATLGLTVLGMTTTTSIALLAVAITLTRGLGQSALSVVSLATVGKWFAPGRIHFAMGVYSLLVGIGFIAAFPTLGAMILKSGWRFSWASVGWTILMLSPVFWFVVQPHPKAGAVASAASRLSLTFGQALATPSFWVFALASALFGLVYSGISLFNQSILERQGMPAEYYHQTLVVSTLLGLGANFAGGWLATRWPIQRLMGLGMAILSVAVGMLPLVRAWAHVLAYGITMGIAGGVITVVFFSVWNQVYGPDHVGKIQGMAQMLTVVSSAVGPLLLAWTVETTGSYNPMFQGLGVLIALLGIACWMVPIPRQTAP